MSDQSVLSPLRLFTRARQLRQIEEQQASSNPFLAQAIENEKREGHQLAFTARTIAFALVMVLLPFLNTNWHVFYYEARPSHAKRNLEIVTSSQGF